VGAGQDPLGGAGESRVRWGGLGVERSIVWVEGVFGSSGCYVAIVAHNHGFLTIGGDIGSLFVQSWGLPG